MIYDEHLEDLEKSGVSESTALSNGLYSVKAGEVTRSPVAQNIIGKTWLIFPYQHTPRFFRAKWFPPVEIDGKKQKYYQEPGSNAHLYVPKWPVDLKTFNSNTEIPLFITEGEKKALCASERHLCCIGLGGIWNWKQKGSPALIEDFDKFVIRGREVYIIPDSDFKLPKHNGQMIRSVGMLSSRLIVQGAIVFTKYLPEDTKGVDDFMVKYGSANFYNLPSVEAELKEEPIDIKEGIANFLNEDKVISSWDFEEMLKHENSVQRKVIKTGFPDIDIVLRNGGVSAGELLIISGKSGHGKSTFCRTWTSYLCENKYNVLWFPFEGIEEDFINLFGDNLPKFYLPKQNEEYTIKWICDRFKETAYKYGSPDLIFIDNLNYMTKGLREESIKNTIHTIINELVELAKKNKTIVVLCVNTLKSANSPHHEMHIGDIRDASSIIDYASLIFMISRDEDNREEKAYLSIVKNRGTGMLTRVSLLKHGEILKDTTQTAETNNPYA